MHIKFKPVWIITTFIVGYILYIVILAVLGLPNPVYASEPNYVRADSSMKPFDPIIPDSVSYARYRTLKDSIKTMRQLKNGVFDSGGGWQFGGFLGTTYGIECDTCTLHWIENVYERDLNDHALKSYDYLILYSWKLKIKSLPHVFLSTDSVQFYAEHNQAYVRKFVKLSYLTKSKNQDYRMIDQPVKFRYDNADNCVMIPVSKTVGKVTEIILAVTVIAVIGYYFLLLGYFFWFLVDVSKGNIFTDLNMIRLKTIAYSLIAVPFILLILNLLLRVIFIPYLTSDVVLKIDTLNSYWKMLALGVVFLIIYSSFRQGKKLKDEQEFTI